MIDDRYGLMGERVPPKEVGAHRRWHDDRGSGTIEFQGVLVVAALLIGAVVGSVVVFPEYTQAALCRITDVVGGGGDCAVDVTADGPPTDEQLQPPVCMLAQTSEGGGVGVDIGFVKLGADWGLQVTEFNDEYHARVTNGASGGVQAEAKGKGGVVDVSASASAELTYQHGDTWIVPKDEWPEFERNAKDYFDQSGWRWLGAGSWWGASEPRPPDVTSHEGGGRAQVAANAKVDRDIEAADPKRGGRITAAGASAQASGSVSVKRERNAQDDSVTWTYTMTGSASAEASVVVAGGSAQVSREGSLSVKRDASGALLEITFDTVARGGVSGTMGLDVELDKTGSGRHAAPHTTSPSFSGGRDSNDVVVTTTVLEITNENREFVEEWLAVRDGGFDAALPMSPVIPSSPSPDDAMLQELYERGKTSRNVYEATDTSSSAGVGVSAGVGGGFEVNGNTGTRQVAEAHFLGSPRANGERPFLPHTKCD
ncbi:hypothetical protein [Cellulomonas xiejunii]|uniref:hypothetical protein n=1 Tax=Cellulomonas xiejunii TaxID=2968083 RepID=UPI001D0DFD32|nr:hypothetical protein [Cellulomonas xiejunii]MCC2312738.1 hypothetical protein [Cellulomonas xiejunii]